MPRTGRKWWRTCPRPRCIAVHRPPEAIAVHGSGVVPCPGKCEPVESEAGYLLGWRCGLCGHVIPIEVAPRRRRAA